MAGLNRVTLVGSLGADPEIRRTQDGRPIVNIRLATSETWRDKNSGERREKTEWHRVVIFNEGLAKIAEQYLQKGTTVYLEGKIRTREWEKDGVKHYTTEVVLEGFDGRLQILKGGMGREGAGDDYGGGRDDRGGGFGGGRTTGGGNRSSSTGGARRGSSGGRTSYDDLDDEIPF